MGTRLQRMATRISWHAHAHVLRAPVTHGGRLARSICTGTVGQCTQFAWHSMSISQARRPASSTPHACTKYTHSRMSQHNNSPTRDNQSPSAPVGRLCWHETNMSRSFGLCKGLTYAVALGVTAQRVPTAAAALRLPCHGLFLWLSLSFAFCVRCCLPGPVWVGPWARNRSGTAVIAGPMADEFRTDVLSEKKGAPKQNALREPTVRVLAVIEG